MSRVVYLFALLALCAFAAASHPRAQPLARIARSFKNLADFQLDCTTCMWLVEAVEFLEESGESVNDTITNLQNGCSAFGPFTSQCDEFISEKVPEIYADVANNESARDVCNSLGYCNGGSSSSGACTSTGGNSQSSNSQSSNSQSSDSQSSNSQSSDSQSSNSGGESSGSQTQSSGNGRRRRVQGSSEDSTGDTGSTNKGTSESSQGNSQSSTQGNTQSSTQGNTQSSTQGSTQSGSRTNCASTKSRSSNSGSTNSESNSSDSSGNQNSNGGSGSGSGSGNGRRRVVKAHKKF